MRMIQPAAGAQLRFECHATLPADPPAQLGAFCDPVTDVVFTSPATGARCADGVATPGASAEVAALTCDAFDHTCEVACSSDADCISAGLLSYVCDPRTADEYFGADRPGALPAGQVHHFCVNPSLCWRD